MTTIEIKKTLAKEVEELSGDALQEVLDFVEFLKIKRWRETAPPQSSRLSVADELRALEMDSLVHLEAEFATYKEDYPYE
ncbi:MAG: DUF2281 domain-containing protein [Anaerolineales bacterium]|nr:DUF2281 domain-containing protein [Anaerolineales bacterium]